MQHAVETTNPKSVRSPNWHILLSAMATIAVTNAAFIFIMIGMLSWQEGAVIVITAAVLTGGALFTAVTMRGLQAHQKFGS